MKTEERQVWATPGEIAAFALHLDQHTIRMAQRTEIANAWTLAAACAFAAIPSWLESDDVQITRDPKTKEVVALARSTAAAFLTEGLRLLCPDLPRAEREHWAAEEASVMFDEDDTFPDLNALSCAMADGAASIRASVKESAPKDIGSFLESFRNANEARRAAFRKARETGGVAS